MMCVDKYQVQHRTRFPSKGRRLVKTRSLISKSRTWPERRLLRVCSTATGVDEAHKAPATRAAAKTLKDIMSGGGG